MDSLRRDDAAVIGVAFRPFAPMLALPGNNNDPREESMRAFRLSIPLVLALTAALVPPAKAEPVKIRVGWIVAPASLVPLLFLEPELAKNYNKTYTFDPVHFASSTLQI